MENNNISKESWNKFVLANQGSFLQSWEWGELQESVGKKVLRLSNCHPEFISGSNSEILNPVQNDKIKWQAQFIKNKIPGVNKFYWYCPRGPIVANSKEQIVNSEFTSPQPSPYKGEGAGGVLSDIIKEAKKAIGKDTVFFRLGPEWDLAGRQSLVASGFELLPYDIEPSQTLILDISKTEEELLAQMHEKWRYNIRLAERKGVKIKMISAQDGDFDKYFEEFYKLVDQGTSERKKIKHYPKEYYRKQLEINPPQPSLKGGSENISPPLGGVRGDVKFLLFVAEYENKVIASNIVVIHGKKGIYLHGATDNNFRNVMAPHLLQWEQIKYAKSQGCAEYDFWGIVNEHTKDKRGPSWEGFTRFKKGFGGQEVNYVGYFDYPLNRNWYFLYRLVQKFRR